MVYFNRIKNNGNGKTLKISGILKLKHLSKLENYSTQASGTLNSIFNILSRYLVADAFWASSKCVSDNLFNIKKTILI